MRNICHILRNMLLSTAFLCSLNAHAASESSFGEGARWACWYASQQVNVQCLLIHVPTEGNAERASQVASRIDRRLPELVKTIWGSPEQLAGYYVSIPLMSIPFEMEFVATLAKSVMCGVRSDCSVLFDKNTDGKASIRAAAMASGESETEVMAEVNAQGITLAQTDVLPAGKRKRRAAADI